MNTTTTSPRLKLDAIAKQKGARLASDYLLWECATSQRKNNPSETFFCARESSMIYFKELYFCTGFMTRGTNLHGKIF
jgi:hypothetical protein